MVFWRLINEAVPIIFINFESKLNTMKKSLYLFLLIASFGVSAQTNFHKGYSEGFKKGFCHQKIGCVAPVGVSLGPSPGQLFSSYKDGYNNGFSDGMKKSQSERRSESQSQSQSPYGRESYRPEFKTFTPDYNQLNKILKARQQSYNNNNNSTKNIEPVTLDDYLSHVSVKRGKHSNDKIKNLRINSINFNSQERKAINIQNEYLRFGKYPVYLQEGEYGNVGAIIYDSEGSIIYSGEEANVWIDEDGEVSLILFFEKKINSKNLSIFKYDSSVQKGMSNDNNSGFIWHLISYQEKVKFCKAEVLVQPYNSQLEEKGYEYKMILVFNNVLRKSKN